MRRAYAAILLALGLVFQAHAQKVPDRDLLEETCDSLTLIAREHFKTESEIKLSRVLKRGNKLDLYLTQDASFFPWHQEDLEWFRNELDESMSGLSDYYSIGEIYSGREKLNSFLTHAAGSNGMPNQFSGAIKDPRTAEGRFIREIGRTKFPKGLDDRYIALWQSHGLYYDENNGYWHFQRAPLFRTIEDNYTQSYVIPFLIPMLENAGAYVLTPRERDINPIEYVVDNDPSFSGIRKGLIRREGRYTESGTWESAGTGFADNRETYGFSTNPFTAGTARKARSSEKKTAYARWRPGLENRGRYAVYISYKSLENSSEGAHYTVHHMGGETEFLVNQKIGGGTWIYLGTFDFDSGDESWVELDNSGKKGTVVTADGVRFGGGMGKVARGGSISGAKSHVEGALYSMVWAGAGEDITQDKDSEYTNEYSSRGAWTKWMKNEKGIPFDLSLAFHSNAGTAQMDSTYGTLAIYTRKSEDGVKLADGRDRAVSRLLCDFVQTQIVEDVRAYYNPKWIRRGIWDKNYSESRTTGVPAMILELLSHQNFNDMKLGLDPSFRFTVSRAVYKGILKTLSDYYGCRYAVQPLPVRNMSLRLSGNDKVLLSWSATEDPHEPTAVPEGYVVYTRIDDGAFDKGRKVENSVMQIAIQPGHIYSFKVVAYNDGGYSFPSEILSAGMPLKRRGSEVVIVNNFTKVSAPYFIDTPEYAGFDGRMDGGIPYIYDISYAGETFEYRRSAEYVDDDNPGFGASHTDHAGEITAGNTYDYPFVHGQALMEIGRPFSSMSSEAFCHDGSSEKRTLDLICGKQGLSQNGGKYGVFPDELKNALENAVQNGCDIFLSGANIASDSTATGFTARIFGFNSASNAASSIGMLAGMAFHNTANQKSYCVENPDGLRPTTKAKTWLRYDGTGIPASVRYDGGTYRCVSLGVPLETLVDGKDRVKILGEVLQYLDRNAENTYHQ
ncbi:MAG: N-acetylmuramoyl-L-alanine amidase [Bacteroidales bacterium]|nr:N-acetylmuramoyl-L-alanine amidase [Bacteroidales bacterium]